MQLWEHQKEAIQRACEVDNFALLFEAGTGKSATLINILRQKFARENNIFNTLILCPTVVCDNWKAEWLKFSKIHSDDLEVLLGPEKKRIDILKKTSARILITNYQSLLMQELFSALKNWGLRCIVADESHRLKTPNSKTTKKAVELADATKYKYILTGTPVLQNLMDIYSQFKFLDGGETFGRNFNSFKNNYFYNANASAPSHVTWPKWVVRPNAEKEVNEKIFKKAMYVEKSKCLDLPPLIKQKIYVDMSLDQTRLYKEMKKNFITYLEGGACVAPIALTKALRLMQIASGFIKLETGEDKSFKENSKAVALKELLSDLCVNNKVIVWAAFKENYHTISSVCRDLGLNYVEVHGEAKNRTLSINTFQENKDCKILIGNQGAGGIGINLTAASYAIYFSRDFSLEHDVQSEARNYRGGSEIHKKITRIDLVSKDTIEDDILEALSSKQAISDSVLKGFVKK